MADFKYSAGIDVNLNIKNASNQLQELQKQLAQISNMKIDVGTGNLTADIEKASQAAMKLSAHLATATNPKTGNLDFTKFYTSIQKSGASLQEYGEALQKMGPAGQKAFVNLADSISKSEIPLKRTSQMVDKMWDGLKRTASWQLQSSIIHGVIGSIQSAVGYAKDLNSSLNDIRIVTGQSTEQMAKFAKQANQAAKNLSTTTTDYTKASLIYYQQGLSDEEVKQRTETTIKMANVSGQSAEKVSSQMTAIWNNYDNGSKSLEYYGDVITALGAKTASSSEEIAQGIQKFAAVSDTIGLSYEYAASALATVTATTRESADVVGNAYKTLFSRIQGLQLGETLDDGTTLNKYSTALAKVGISIKDSSGNLKDMDSILNEMGSKWETLSKDQQTALAQTVAGVRQYTQLVALMNNWDYFQENLQTAKTSSGTLNAQAAIYAESWEAASDRVRASWEGLWDNLIDSDGFITILNGLSGIVKLMDKMTTSIGGAGGVLTSFLGIATKVFAPHITKGLRDTIYNINMAFGGEKKMLAARESFLTNAINKVDVNGEFGELYGSNEAQARKDSMISQMRASLMYTDNSRNMTPLQHQIEQQYAQMTQIQDQRVIDAAASLDAAKNARYDTWADLMYRDKGGDEEGILERSRRDVAQIGQYNLKARKNDMTRNDYLAAQQKAGEFISQAKADTLLGSKPIKEVLEPFSSSLNEFYKTLSSPDALKSQQSVDKLTGLLNDLNKTGYQSKGYDKIISQMQQKIQGAYSQGITSIDLSKEFSKLFSLQGNAAGGIGFGQLIESYLKQNFEVGKNEANLTDEERRARNLRANRQANLNEKQNIDWATALVTGGQGAMMALSAGQSIQALIEQLSTGTTDAVTSLSSITSAIFSFGVGLNAFKTLLTGLKVASAGPWALGITALITALPVLFNLFDQFHVSEKEKLQQEAETQNNLQNAVAQSKNYHESLSKTVDTYENNQKALTKLIRGTNEWTSSLYNANQAASKLISENNLVEGKDYFRNSFGALEIKDEVLNNLTDASKEAVEKASNVKDLSSINKTIRTDERKYEENLDEIKNDLWDRRLSRNDEYKQVNDAIADLQIKYGIIEQSEYDAQLNELYKRRDALYTNYGPEKTFQSINDIDYDFVIKEAIDILSKDRNAFSDIETIQSKLGLENDLMMAEEIYKITDKLLLVVDQQNANNAIANENYENLARNFLSDEVYKNDENVLSASGRILRNLSEDNKATSEKEYNQNHKSIAQEYADMIGLGIDENFKILGQTISGDVKYQYTDNGKIAQSTFSKNTLIEFDSASKSLDQLMIATHSLDTVFNDLNKTSQDADGALQSYIAEQNMGKATLQQMNALANYLDGKTELNDKQSAIEEATGLSVANQRKIAELEGISIEDWVDGLLKNLTETISDAVPQLDRVKIRLGGKDNLSNFIDGLNIENLKLLDSTLTNIKAIEGQNGLDSYVNALTNLIGSIDDVDSNSLIQMLLNLENTGSAAGNLQDIQAIIEGLGGSFEGATSAAQTFAAALASINAPGLDGILSKINQIKDALGDTFNLKTGQNVNEEIKNNIVKAFPELEGLFIEDIIKGGFQYTGTEETAKKVARDNYLKTGENIAQMQEWSKGTAQSWKSTAGEEFYSMSDWGNEIRKQFERNTMEATEGGDQGEDFKIEGGPLQMFSLLATGALGQGALDAVIAQNSNISSGKDITTQLINYQNAMQRMNNILVNTKDTNNDGKVDYSDIQDASTRQEYLEQQEVAINAESILSNIWALIEQLANPEGLDQSAKDFEKNKGQTAIDTEDLAEMYGMDPEGELREATKSKEFGNGNLMAENEDLQNYATNLAKLGEQYGFSADQAALLSEAIANQDWATAEALMGQVEMSTAIAETAKARGLDAAALAAQTAQISDSLSEAGLSAKQIANTAADMLIAQEGLDDLKSSAKDFQKIMSKISSGKMFDANDVNNLTKMANAFDKVAGTADLGVKNTNKWNQAFKKFLKDNPQALEEFSKGQGESIKKFQAFQAQMKAQEMTGKDFMSDENDALDQFGETAAKYSDLIDKMEIGQSLQDAFGQGTEATQELSKGMADSVQDLMQAGLDMDQATDLMSKATDFQLIPVEEMGEADVAIPIHTQEQEATEDALGAVDIKTLQESNEISQEDAKSKYKFFKMVKKGGSGGSKGGGGGGGGGKEPKKVANKRKSQSVKRYKRADAKRSSTEKYKKSEENKKDYLYGESKIAQMEKINKLAEKEAKITADRIKESRTYLIEDRENLIKYLQKYGYEAEFDADGFLANYEKVWTDVYEQIAALYEDNELTEEEGKIEEDLNVMLEELEGALEDYENSLSELQDDIEAYEETLFEMYDNKVEALEHKVEFKIELSEDDLDYLDFWIESLGDNVYNALEAIEAMGAKANALFNGLETYQQGIIDIMSLSDDPLQVWATGGIEGILTQAQVDALRDNRDGLVDYMQQLIDLRDEIKDKVLDTFDDWQEKLDSTLTTIEHYTSVLEHFKNMIDIVGKDSLGLSNQFMANLEQNAINQSLDSINANKAYYDNLVEIQQEAQEKLEEARARGDQSSADHWEEIVKSTTEAMQDAQDALLTSLEDSLNLIAEQFETNMERAIEAFNDAIYAYGGLEGLSNDYSLIRENADLMAADYEKIYELSKITRNINKTLDDTNIIAGKQKLISLQREINSLQNSGVELSKYDLEYLQAKYELRLAEIELENAQNAKDTVRLSRDSEGNWSYIYTQNADAVEEAGQKYEDALYEMQKLSQEYLEEMSSSMLDTSSAMMEEISGLRIQDFNSYEEYQAEIKRIQDKYAESLKLQESELNKAVSNSQQIYEQDWHNYNLITGYKISESEKWIDTFKESTIGQLLNSDTIMSSFSDTFLGLTEILTKNLADSAVSYFTNIDKAFATYGTSIEDFGKHVEDSTKKISDKSKEAAGDAKKMASEMNDAFKEIADTVSSWQEQFSSEIDKMLEKIKTLIQDINEAIETSANLQSDNRNSSELIGQDEAIDLLNEQKLWGTWGRSENGALTLNGNATTFTDFNGELIQEIDDKMTKMFNAKTGSEERSKLEEEVKELFKQYWLFKDIVGRVYDVTDLQAPTYASLDTGGYTGEWGDSGKFAMLHEKELVLNKDDTKNFLDALNLSKDIINSMIEMNAKQSSLALGDLVPTSIQDMSQVLEQSVTIQAEFPNATDHSEIEEAFNNLINTASQYANRRK